MILSSPILALVQAVAAQEGVLAIGLSGEEQPPPEPGQGDLDLFVYCSQVPGQERRKAALAGLGSAVQSIVVDRPPDLHWGQPDSMLLDGVETWLMYFPWVQARTEVDEILAGQWLDRQDGDFYPLGRLAMFASMRILHDPNSILAAAQRRLAVYPSGLAQKELAYHLAALDDREDQERAVRRGDVLFYHYALDRALDHFLMALFALNRAWFPSRKRSLECIQGFALQPEDCPRRLQRIVEAGSRAASLEESAREWFALAEELSRLARENSA